MLKKNDIFPMTCERFGQDAAGVCRHEGQAVFVPYLLPDERADVRIVRAEKRYAFGRVEKLLEASPARREPPCPAYRRCGGCACQHMAYETSLETKRSQVQELLRRVGGVDFPVPPVLGMDNPWQYRNKGTYPVANGKGGPVCGFFAPRSHDLVPLPPEGCRIQRPESAAALRAILSYMKEYAVPAFDEQTHTGTLRHVMTRTSPSGQTVVTLISAKERLPREERLIDALREAVPGLSGLCLLHNPRTGNVILNGPLRVLWGQAELPMPLYGMTFAVSPQAFFQVNPEQTERLYGIALDFAALSPEQTALDAYCGTGTISLLLSRRAAKVIGIEIVPEAIENAERNAAGNGVTNCEFLCGATETLLPRLCARGVRPDVALLDPPRKGCEAVVLEALAEAKTPRIVYIACGAPALARDTARLAALGYTLTHVQCVDMFPWTGDVETVAVFERA